MIDTLRAEFPESMTRATHPAAGTLESFATGTLDSVLRYAKEKPESALLWAVGIGFVLGWKLKPSW